MKVIGALMVAALPAALVAAELDVMSVGAAICIGIISAVLGFIVIVAAD